MAPGSALSNLWRSSPVVASGLALLPSGGSPSPSPPSSSGGASAGPGGGKGAGEGLEEDGEGIVELSDSSALVRWGTMLVGCSTGVFWAGTGVEVVIGFRFVKDRKGSSPLGAPRCGWCG